MPSIFPAEDDLSSAMARSFAQAVSVLHKYVCKLYRVVAADNASALIRRKNRGGHAKRSASCEENLPYFLPGTGDREPCEALQLHQYKRKFLALAVDYCSAAGKFLNNFPGKLVDSTSCIIRLRLLKKSDGQGGGDDSENSNH